MDARAYPDPYQPLDVHLSSVLGFDSGWGTVTYDSTVYGGAYRGQATPADQNWVAFPCRLGPVGSVWGFDVVYRKGPGYGRLAIDLATSSEDGLTGATGYEGPGLAQQPFDVSFVQVNGFAEDGYDAAPSSDFVAQRSVQFRIGGNSGVPLTAFSTDPVTGGLRGDGGPGLYWVRFRVNGKHASSSGYAFDIQYAAAERVLGG